MSFLCNALWHWALQYDYVFKMYFLLFVLNTSSDNCIGWIILFGSSKGWLPHEEDKPREEGGSEAGQGIVHADKVPILLLPMEEQRRLRHSLQRSPSWSGGAQFRMGNQPTGPNQWETCPGTGVAATTLRWGPWARAWADKHLPVLVLHVYIYSRDFFCFHIAKVIFSHVLLCMC